MAEASTVTARLPAVTASAAEARRLVRETAMHAGARERLATDACLAVTEACANIVLHAYRPPPPPPGATFLLELRVADQHLWIRVRDFGVGLRPRPDSPGLGLGLKLIRALAAQVDVVAADGTDVQMRFDLSG